MRFYFAKRLAIFLFNLMGMNFLQQQRLNVNGKFMSAVLLGNEEEMSTINLIRLSVVGGYRVLINLKHRKCV